jgi:ABC-2 type transport system permease protein
LLLLFCSTIVFLSAAISLGVLISVISDSQQVAFMIATMMSLLPSVILSGFIFPIESMPPIIQIISNITPVKFYIITLRAIILRGVGLSAFWEQWVYLILFTVTFLTLAAVGFLKQLKNN